MSEVKIVATLTPFPEHVDAVRKAARAMVAPTHLEPGCLQYDFHESQETNVKELEKPGKVSFVFIERWTSVDDLKKHVAMDYHDRFLEELDGKLESLNVQRLTQLEKSK
ncbi:putative quinol monooxygenase [Serratia sp. AKBS12]|uniref:putative quinol monooxygenase n=1 Tax=Serratia sp. AKBS12 TaxID=2974597 RepID=UPI00216581F8|nr:putative quinol monooxygenase [Serratia sp. AKBS12]MCS3407253.1 antibiotic biosynthesis monooxygenase [Serratia sp. AKBS12]HEI8868503.1 antibiotic biosynthesis monooxygenase [Serratia odorifera]